MGIRTLGELLRLNLGIDLTRLFSSVVACFVEIKSSAAPDITPMPAEINASTTMVPADSPDFTSDITDSATLNKTPTAAPAFGKAAETAPDAAPHSALFNASF